MGDGWASLRFGVQSRIEEGFREQPGMTKNSTRDKREHDVGFQKLFLCLFFRSACFISLNAHNMFRSKGGCQEASSNDFPKRMHESIAHSPAR